MRTFVAVLVHVFAVLFILFPQHFEVLRNIELRSYPAYLQPIEF